MSPNRPRQKGLRWYRVYGYWRTNHWPVKIEANTLAFDSGDALSDFRREVITAGESFQLKEVRLMGSVTDYRNRYGVDGQLDIGGIPV